MSVRRLNAQNMPAVTIAGLPRRSQISSSLRTPRQEPGPPPRISSPALGSSSSLQSRSAGAALQRPHFSAARSAPELPTLRPCREAARPPPARCGRPSRPAASWICFPPTATQRPPMIMCHPATPHSPSRRLCLPSLPAVRRDRLVDATESRRCRGMAVATPTMVAHWQRRTAGRWIASAGPRLRACGLVRS